MRLKATNKNVKGVLPPLTGRVKTLQIFFLPPPNHPISFLQTLLPLEKSLSNKHYFLIPSPLAIFSLSLIMVIPVY